MLAFVLAACGSEDVTQGPPTFTPLPTLTPTLRSTPLPEVSPVEPFGQDRPIHIGFVAQDVSAATVRALETTLNAEFEGDIDIEVDVFPSMGTALAAVCDGTRPTMVWVDPFTYIAAEQSCSAEVRLGLERTPSATRLNNFEIIYNTDLEPRPTGLADIVGKRWCRISAQDEVSWIYPSLAMQTASINPLSDLSQIVEVADYAALVNALIVGDCDMGAIPQGTLRGYVRQIERESRADDDTTNDVNIVLVGPTSDLVALDSTWVAVPADVFVVPPTTILPADQQNAIVAIMNDILTDADEDSPIRALLTYADFGTRVPADYAAFRQWLIEANWAMSR